MTGPDLLRHYSLACSAEREPNAVMQVVMAALYEQFCKGDMA